MAIGRCYSWILKIYSKTTRDKEVRQKKYLMGVVAGLAFLGGGITQAFADDNSNKSVSYAFALCKMLDGTNMLSEPCSVSGWNSSVDISLDMNASEARTLCPQIAGMLKSNNIIFRDGWTLKISSPYSGDKAIATCVL
ncbi:hypothetical protein [Pseudomonas lundensis]|uniref:hypothetical protein n=1 Tax=Pseudomonas lundensis TaxID=86185 RepID=UPI001D02E594|nr:hypothetical protein [Pseudomonas lundensis]